MKPEQKIVSVPELRPGVHDWFRRFAHRTSDLAGSPWLFFLSLLIVVAWGLSGPIFRYSDTWQLVINTGTTIVTFLMVFLIQNTQNRDSKAIHLKLDELIRAVKGARKKLVDLEDLSDEELQTLQEQFEKVRERAERVAGRKGGPDEAHPEKVHAQEVHAEAGRDRQIKK